MSLLQRRGCVVGVFEPANKDWQGPIDRSLVTRLCDRVNAESDDQLLRQLNCSKALKRGDCRLLYGLSPRFDIVAAVGLGEKGAGVSSAEARHDGRENVRVAAAIGAVALRDAGATSVAVDPCVHADAAAEGAILGLFAYDELKEPKKRVAQCSVELADDDENEYAELWREGEVGSEMQNAARRLMEMPANLLTPTKFAEFAAARFANDPTVQVVAHDRAWAEQQEMRAFLSVAAGSDRYEPPVFLEIRLKPTVAGSSEKPLVLVGKGVCFDSGGLSLKPPARMDEMRADMGGAAVMLAALDGCRRLKGERRREVVLLAPLVENLPGGGATRPGDIIRARDGTSIKVSLLRAVAPQGVRAVPVDNTDAEGRLILADALCYASTELHAEHVLVAATLTGAMRVALGNACAGVFSNDDVLWHELQRAAKMTGDRLWRLPVFEHYASLLKTATADVANIDSRGAGGGACVAAAFLKRFIKCPSWAHMDIAGVMDSDGEIPYMKKGLMAGRPTRTIIKWLCDRV